MITLKSKSTRILNKCYRIFGLLTAKSEKIIFLHKKELMIVIIIIIIIIISNGNRTDWSTIPGIIGRVISSQPSA